MEAEQAAIEEGVSAYEYLMAKLVDVPTPAGPTPRRINHGLVQITALRPASAAPNIARKRMREKSEQRGSYTRLVNSSLLILTGASGAGKTTLAYAVQKSFPNCEVRFFDSIGVPSAEVMATYDGDYGPGGGWQRAMTVEWMQRIAPLLKSGKKVLFEGQMRIAFIEEAIAATGITNAYIVLVDCSDAVRTARLIHDRNQPDLANENMMSWGRFLRDEAKRRGYEILDTGSIPFNGIVDRLIQHLR